MKHLKAVQESEDMEITYAKRWGACEMEFLRKGLGRIERKFGSGGKWSAARSGEVRREDKREEEKRRGKWTWRNRGQRTVRKARGQNIYQRFVQNGLGGNWRNLYSLGVGFFFWTKLGYPWQLFSPPCSQPACNDRQQAVLTGCCVRKFPHYLKCLSCIKYYPVHCVHLWREIMKYKT